jgi:disulfide bond formation protein DsbB
MSKSLVAARALTIIAPAAALAAAWGSQLLGGLYPCEMCHWQRWPHYAALAVALIGLIPPLLYWRFPITIAALLIFISGGIGVFHAGVEYGWWEGLTRCSTTGGGGSQADILAEIMATPLVRCDVAQWTFHGLSLAGMNAIFSILSAIGILWLTIRSAD